MLMMCFYLGSVVSNVLILSSKYHNSIILYLRTCFILLFISKNWLALSSWVNHLTFFSSLLDPLVATATSSLIPACFSGCWKLKGSGRGKVSPWGSPTARCVYIHLVQCVGAERAVCRTQDERRWGRAVKWAPCRF